MQRDLEGLADIVVLTVKSAIAPLLERLAVAEAKLAQYASAEQMVAELRERVVIAETKSASLLKPQTNLDDFVVRLAAAETRIAAERDNEPLIRRIEALENRTGVTHEDIAAVRERIASIESKSAQTTHADDALADLVEIKKKFESLPSSLEKAISDAVSDVPSPGITSQDVQSVYERIAALERKADVVETRLAAPDPLGAVVEKTDRAVAELSKDLGAIRERIAVVEVRAAVPGPPGPAGKDGRDGKDGADGLGFDDLVAEQDDDRGFTIKAARGERVKVIGTARFPNMVQRGVYVDGKEYEKGDVVTRDGSQWHANETTSAKPGENQKAWTLIVKRGRDGRDGRDLTPAATALPVVSVGKANG